MNLVSVFLCFATKTVQNSLLMCSTTYVCTFFDQVQVAVEMPKDGSGHEMICTSDREDYDSDRSSNERYEAKEDRNVDESSCSPLTDQSSEVIQCSWSSTSVSKPKNHLSLHVHKRRKGIPYRAPLR